MFNRLKRTLDEALRKLESAFGAGPDEEIDDLLRAMREELIQSRARLPELEGQIRTFRAQIDIEVRKVEECVRRAVQAESIDDQETVDVARRFEANHRSRAQVLQQKLEAAEAELSLQKQTVADQTSQLKSALAQRDAILAQARRGRATQNLRGGGPSAVDDFERMASQIDRDADVGSATREVDDLLTDDPSVRDPFVEPADPEGVAEEQLRELKRRMVEEERRKRGG